MITRVAIFAALTLLCTTAPAQKLPSATMDDRIHPRQFKGVTIVFGWPVDWSPYKRLTPQDVKYLLERRRQLFQRLDDLHAQKMRPQQALPAIPGANAEERHANARRMLLRQRHEELTRKRDLHQIPQEIVRLEQRLLYGR